MSIFTTTVAGGKRVAVPSRTVTIPAGTSQSAADAIIASSAPRSTVVLGVGTHNISLDITKYKTQVVAEVPGQVWVSGARSGAETWTNESTIESTSDLWSCPMAYTPNVVLLAAATFRYHLLRYGTLAELKSRTMPTTSSYGPSGRTAGIGPIVGYTVTGGKLYVRLPSGYDPTTLTISIARSGVTYGMQVSADDVSIRGIRFTCQDTASILAANNVQRPNVTHNYAEGTQVMFKALGSGATVPNNGLFFDHNEMNGGKLYTWRVESLTKELWDALYDSNLSCRFVRANTRSIYVGHSYWYESFDGLEIKGFDTTSEPVTCLIEYNVGDGCVDNHIEIEPWQQNIFMVCHHNFFKDGFTPFATAPFGGDRCEMTYNIYWHSLDGIGINDTSVQTIALLKTLSHSGIDARVSQMKGLQWSHNTVRIGGGATCRIYTVGDTAQNEAAEQWAYDVSFATFNIVDGGAGFISRQWALQSAPVPSGGTGTPSPAVGTARPGTGYQLGKNVFRGGNYSSAHYTTDSSLYDTRAPAGDVINTDPQFGTTPTTYFHPTNSTIVARGDGAIVNGSWGFRGVPGPDWATAANMPQRRAWRSTVSKSYVNL